MQRAGRCLRGMFRRVVGHGMTGLQKIVLLVLSNVFMTFAWCAQLGDLRDKPWVVAALASWGIAFFEYLIHVPANRLGHQVFSLAQLKLLQEAVTLAVFVPFAVFYMREKLTWNHAGAALCLMGAVFFIFRRQDGGDCGCARRCAAGCCRRFESVRMKRHYLRLVRQALRSLRHPQLRDRPWWRAIMRPVTNRALWIPCRDTVAAGMAIGLFFSMMLMPFQMIPAALLAMRLKANVPFAIASCWVTNPVTTPPVLFGQYVLGKWLRDTLSVPMPPFLVKVQFDVPAVGQLNAASFILGMIVSAVLLSLVAFPLVHLFSALMPQHLPVRRRRSGVRRSACVGGAADGAAAGSDGA
jgi:uncharacterized protein (DUF486 family)/uncharacterized protein (DUF2062 family)